MSSASAQIEATAGANIKNANGRPSYGRVGAILIGVVAAWIILCCLVGREYHGAHFEQGKAAFEEGAGRDEIEERESLSFAEHGSFLALSADDRVTCSQSTTRSSLDTDTTLRRASTRLKSLTESRRRSPTAT